MLKFPLIWAVGASSVWLFFLFGMSSLILEHLTSFLVQQNILGLSWRNQTFFQGTLIPFTGVWHVETKICALGVLIATGLSLLLGSLTKR